MGYPEDLPLTALCSMEGHNWGREGGGICLNCGERLRCGACGRLTRLDKLSSHIDNECPVKWDELEAGSG